MKKIAVVILTFLLAGSIYAQQGVTRNLPDYDSRMVHWGFSFGVNKLDFMLFKTADFATQDTLTGIVHGWMPSGHLGPAVSIQMARHVDFRFLINLTFQQRTLNYYFANGDYQKVDINSTLLQTPILFKYKGNRYGNIRPYVIGGAAPTFDLSARKRIITDQPHVYLTPEDVYLEVGTGFDFFLQYFKLSTELKFGYGLFDVTVHDPNYLYTRYIDQLHSYYLMLTFHFEG